MGKSLKVLAFTVRTPIEVSKTIWTVQPLPHSNAHDLPTIKADAGLQFDPLKAEASEQIDLMTTRNARGVKESTHQRARAALSEHAGMA